jgi:hypothetical protein
MIGAARKPETQVPGTNPGPVASGPNSVPNTKPLIPSPAPFQDPLESASVLGAGEEPAAAIC